MDLKATKKELEAAYERMDKLEKQISNLLAERKDNAQIMEVLKAAGFIHDEKIQQAREILQGLDS